MAKAKTIKLTATLNHDGKEHEKGSVLVIGKDITEQQANRLINFGVARLIEAEVVLQDKIPVDKDPAITQKEAVKTPTEHFQLAIEAQSDEQLANAAFNLLGFDEKTKFVRKAICSQLLDKFLGFFKQVASVDINNTSRLLLEEKLTECGITFDASQSDDELKQLHQDYLDSVTAPKTFEVMTRDELIKELNDAEIEFNESQSDAELRTLLEEHYSFQELKPVEAMTREELESELTAAGVSFKSNNSDNTLRKLITDLRADSE